MGPSDSSDRFGQKELRDDELVLAIIAGEAKYSELRRRAPDRITAARFFASVASARSADRDNGTACDICGRPGSKVTLKWAAILLRRREHIIESLILFPIVLLTIFLGGILSEARAGACRVEFQTQHILCGRCRPGLVRSIGVLLLDIVTCMLSLASLAALMFTTAVLVSWLVGAFEIGPDFAAAVFPWFLLSLAFLLSHLTRWRRRLARVVGLPPSLRGLASGPFETYRDGSFHLRAAGD